MRAEHDSWVSQPLLADRPAAATMGWRLAILLAWVAVTAWLAANHVPWRDEIRAWSLMQQASGIVDLFRVVQGEGHPYLWYVLLRLFHDLFGVREVLPALGFVIGFAAAALLALKAPLRLGVIAVLLFSLHIGFDYSVLARNYGISALLLFLVALTYSKAKDSLWLGVLLFFLVNTNAPSVLLAGALFLYRMIELALERPALRSASVKRLVVNGLILLAGVLLCFVAVYPPVNDLAASSNRVPFTAWNLVGSIVDAERSFAALGFDRVVLATNIFLLLSIGTFIRSKPAFFSALAGFLALKFFFFFIFPAVYRHASLFLMFLVTLLWIEADKRRTASPASDFTKASPIWAWGLVLLLAIQSVLYVRNPVLATLEGRPWSNAAKLAAIMDQPGNAGSILITDPDALGETLVYFTGRPFWLMRQERFGTIAPFSSSGVADLTPDDFLVTAQRLHASTGRPVLIAMKRDLAKVSLGREDVMYGNTTTFTRDNIARFRAGTRQVADLRDAFGDENYTVYRYPR